DYQALDKKGKDLKLDTGSAKPEDALKQRGIDDKAIDTLKNADKLDAQATATSSDPDLAGRTPAQLAETHVDANKNPLTPMSATQKQDTIAAQSALSEDIKQGADVRKAVTNESVLDMLAGGYVKKDESGNPVDYGKTDRQTMGGDIGLKRSTEGQTSTEVAETLGLDYQHSSNTYAEFADPKNLGKTTGWSDQVKNEGIAVIDTKMTADMAAQARVPLRHDVMAEAKT